MTEQIQEIETSSTFKDIADVMNKIISGMKEMLMSTALANVNNMAVLYNPALMDSKLAVCILSEMVETSGRDIKMSVRPYRPYEEVVDNNIMQSADVVITLGCSPIFDDQLVVPDDKIILAFDYKKLNTANKRIVSIHPHFLCEDDHHVSIEHTLDSSVSKMVMWFFENMKSITCLTVERQGTNMIADACYKFENFKLENKGAFEDVVAYYHAMDRIEVLMDGGANTFFDFYRGDKMDEVYARAANNDRVLRRAREAVRNIMVPSYGKKTLRAVPTVNVSEVDSYTTLRLMRQAHSSAIVYHDTPYGRVWRISCDDDITKKIIISSIPKTKMTWSEGKVQCAVSEFPVVTEMN